MTAIYHITHLENLPAIIRDGRLWCHRKVQASGLCSVDIGHENIKDRREVTSVPVSAKGVVADYVPFYFAPRSPMLFAISKGKVAQYQGGQDDVAYLVCDAETVAADGHAFCFTNGHAVMALSDFFEELTDLPKVDWEIMKEHYWTDTITDPDRKRRRQAEFLIHQFCPFDYVHTIAVKCDRAAEAVKGLLGKRSSPPQVVVRPDWYY